MGREVQCEARLEEAAFFAKAQLEDGMILLRGEKRLDLPTNGFQAIEAQSNALL
jgi:hypothetical protein